jgi:hypothetical protein
MAEVTETQRIDLDRIRGYAKESGEIGPMIEELCDLVEGSTLLQDASNARVGAKLLDDFAAMGTNCIADLDPDPILPKE